MREFDCVGSVSYHAWIWLCRFSIVSSTRRPSQWHSCMGSLIQSRMSGPMV